MILIKMSSKLSNLAGGYSKNNSLVHPSGGGGGTSYIGLYREAKPKRGTFFRLQVYTCISDGRGREG